jgi:putative hydrolase
MSDNYIMDLHTHTIASGHAYNTINEMINSAAEKQMKLLGITEHGPAILGGANKYYFQNLNIMSRNKYGIHVLYGCELNIIDYYGTIDLEKDICSSLDYCIVSLHHNCITPGSKRENTNALLHAIQNDKVAIIGHMDDGHFPIDFEAVVKEAKDRNILIEFNNSSLNPLGFRCNAEENDKIILKLCQKLDMHIILSSDAHREEDIGEFSRSCKIIKELEFPVELIVNNSIDSLKMHSGINIDFDW